MSAAHEVFDENVVCPVTGAELLLDGEDLRTRDGSHRYAIDRGILRLFVDPDAPPANTTHTVQDFYTDAPFPNYGEFDDIQTFVARAEKGYFARSLSRQIPPGSSVLEAGCGTGQLSNYLAATSDCRVYASDMTLASLELGCQFAAKNDIQGVRFLQMNLFHPCIPPASMDVVISSGVLHHTADPKAAFFSIVPLVKPGGHIVIGLYNTIGRLRTDLRRVLYRVFGERALDLDPRLRGPVAPEKRRSWIRDQYLHPQESKHSMSEVLGWFREAGIEFVSSRPKIVGRLGVDEPIFEARPPGTAVQRFSAEARMLFSQYGDGGGLFVMIGRRPER